jgi:hypothetical protein
MLCHFMSCFFGFLLEWHAIVLTSFFSDKEQVGWFGFNNLHRLQVGWFGVVTFSTC